MTKVVQISAGYFNPRPHMGSDLERMGLLESILNFNPRPHMGSDRQLRFPLYIGNPFQSTPPHGERPAMQVDWITVVGFQSTPPHGERHVTLLLRQSLNVISIHAPTWGATGCFCPPCKAGTHFNPRPHMGSDDISPLSKCILINFNPRPHMGSDRKNRQSRTDRIRVFTQTFIQTSISYLLIMQ